LETGAPGSFVNRKMKVRQCSVSGVTGQGDFLTGLDLLTDLHKCAVLLQMVILTGRSVVVHHDDEVGIFSTTVLPASFVVLFLDASNDAATGGMNRCADFHPEIHSVLLDTSVAEP
jgi:hypothetical protein